MEAVEQRASPLVSSEKIAKTNHLTPEHMAQDGERARERERGQLRDKEGRWEVVRNRKKNGMEIEWQTWLAGGMKTKRLERGGAHGKYAV